MKKLFFLAITCLSLVSCQIGGLTPAYNHLSDNAKKKVINYDGKIDDVSDYNNVYVITHEQVKAYLSRHKEVVVYDYTPFCNSDFCVSPTVFSGVCKEEGIDFIVISNVYDDLFKHINYYFPLFMINNKKYKTKWRWKYIKAFYFGLIGTNDKNVIHQSYHYFINGTYIGSCRDISEISTMRQKPEAYRLLHE